jgi:hypothetical protein
MSFLALLPFFFANQWMKPDPNKYEKFGEVGYPA